VVCPGRVVCAASAPPAPHPSRCASGVDADLNPPWRDGAMDISDFLVFQQNFTGSL